MTKLEQKLQELGYKEKEDYYYKHFYSDDDYVIAYIVIIVNEYKVCDYKTMIAPPYAFIKNKHIETLQQAFNEMQRDLEILKAIDKPTPKNDIGNDLWEKDVKHMQELGEWERKQWNH